MTKTLKRDLNRIVIIQTYYDKLLVKLNISSSFNSFDSTF